MKTRPLVPLVILLALSATGATDISAKWTGSFKVNGGDHEIPQIIFLKQEGTKITGSAGPDPGEQYPLEKGKIEGDRITFELTTGEWRFYYDLKLSGDAMNGTLRLKSVNASRTAVIKLNRSK